jgi:hypothetical protein
MKIISRRYREDLTHYTRSFHYADCPGAGFGFPCDAQGNVKPEDAASVAECLTGKVARIVDQEWQSTGDGNYVSVPGTGRVVVETMIDDGIVEWPHSYTHPAVGECDACRRHVTLDGFTNTCECGADYSMSGQRLASREQWGEETGESLADILGIG